MTKKMNRVLVGVGMFGLVIGIANAEEESPEIIGALFGENPIVPPVEAEPPEAPDLEIVETFQKTEGGRKIVLMLAKKPDLPEEPVVSPPAQQPLTPPSPPETVAYRSLVLAVTVYDGKTSRLRWVQDGEDYEVWSNIDFEYLTGFTGFEAGETHYSFMLLPSRVNTEQLIAADRADLVPAIPELPLLEESAAFAVTIGDESNDSAIHPILALHQIFVEEEERLKAALAARKIAHAERAAFLLANPPEKKDIKIYFWPLVGE